MDMSVVFLITIGLLGYSVVAGLFQTVTVVVRQRGVEETGPSAIRGSQ